MKQYLFSLLVALCLTGVACAEETQPARDAGTEPSDAADAPDATDAADGAEPDAGDTDVDAEPDADSGGATEIPDEITTEGASFGGVIEAGEAVELDLVAEEGDLVVIWLRVDGQPEWDPRLELYRIGEEPGVDDPLMWGDPDGEADAHLPYDESELDDGFEFFVDGRYPLVLENQSQVDGDFAFSLECLGGPCDGDDGGGDPSGPGEDPYEDLEGDELRDKMREVHRHHSGVSYTRAREEMFGDIDNEDGTVECVYTGQTIQTDDIPDHTQFNTEHTWPQSRGAGSGDPKSDLHHLFPTDSRANQQRAAYHFAEVVHSVSWSEGGSKLGADDSGATRFEPRDEHKGNVARALFYFAAVYDHSIPQHEETHLRDWHEQDPVDAAEETRNDAIYEVQNSRNPFIDYPELVDRIEDF